MDTSTSHVRRVIILGFLIIFMVATAGCSQPENKPAPEQGNEEQNKPIPGEFKKLQSSLDQLYEELKPQLSKAGGNQQQQGQGDQGEEGEQQGQGEQQGEQQGQDEQGGQGTQEIDWDKFQTQAERIHDQWNRFETRAVEAGAKAEDIDGIEMELDTLPTQIAAQDRSGARLAVNSAASYLPDFMELYSTKVPPDLYRTQVMTRGVMIRVDDGDWAGAEQEMLEMKTTWSKLLVQIKDVAKEETDKTHLAQLDLESALQKRDQMLVLIKGNILEKDLNDLIEQHEASM
ncbi:MAG: hypothetical protein PHX16_02590 [Syntrophaceticus sp.]|nr:hypothetical protein [Syntrophaceticus sp.]MDD4360512.1 hypothetical protein [Syntrophaceticus sp.]MDD4782521.1 hypothetical protein [Syntrophaceticus sp.]HBG23093.1 hypothetical protein [Peptococcaceae bacterium]